ncbi:PIN domain-containing protein [Paenibacillus sp. 8b26]|uniref:PIN domain-containing protein n=1 Tax=Paenibacillus sp. 8b26 TaxID=3424133 RepID=UPI003D65BFC2
MNEIASKLKTKNVFLDTNPFVADNFFFGGARFNQLQKLVENDIINLYITHITKREIEKKIVDFFTEAKTSFKTLINKHSILKSNDYLREINNDGLLIKTEVELIKKFKEYVKSCKFTTIEINNVNIERVFNKYFDGMPPFGTGKKKSEFPDAFVVAALNDWCLSNNEEMYVISADTDFKNSLEDYPNLIHLEKIDHLLDLTIDEFTHARATNALENSKEFIGEEIKKFFADDLYTFYIVDATGEVDSVTVNDLNFIDPFYIQSTEGNAATITTTVEMNAILDVSYIDEYLSLFDKEEGTYLFEVSGSTQVDFDESFEVKFNIEFDENDYLTISHIILNNDKSFEIALFSEYYD